MYHKSNDNKGSFKKCVLSLYCVRYHIGYQGYEYKT